MRTMNRAAVIVRHREPFHHWARGIDLSARLNAIALDGHVSIYLVPEDLRGENEAPPMTDFFIEIFEAELEKWCADASLWPAPRDFGTFRAWFEITTQSLVVDLGWDPIKVEKL